MSIVFKTIKTPFNNYIYDRNTSSITEVDDEEFEFFAKMERGLIQDYQDAPLLKNMQDKGLCCESILEEIEHPETKYLKYKLNTKVEKLTLQVTQNCNLRCQYCTYSGNYESQRTHSNKNMSIETMKKGIDFLMTHSREIDKVNIGFYGGEPLLRKDLLKECFSYIKSNYDDKKVFYNMTSNGTLLDDETVELLQSNNVSLAISLDGSEEIHDTNRIKADGNGSFQVIMENLEQTKKLYPDFFKKISFSPVIGINEDLNSVISFFENNSILKDLPYNVGTINDLGSIDDISYNDKYFVKDNIESLKVILVLLNKLDRKHVTTGYLNNISKITYFHKKLMKKMPFKDHPGGPCVPGLKRLFMDVNGNFYPCERVPENLEALQIGDIESGFNINKINTILNIGKLTESECLKCWCFKLCGVCVAGSVNDSGLSKEIKLSNCNAAKISAFNDMRTLCLLKDYKFNFQEAKHE